MCSGDKGGLFVLQPAVSKLVEVTGANVRHMGDTNSFRNIYLLTPHPYCATDVEV